MTTPARPAPDVDGVVERLLAAAERAAKITQHDLHEGLTVEFAQMAQYRLTEAAKVLQSEHRARIEAEAAEEEAKDCFWAVYPIYVETTGRGISTEAARSALSAEIDSLRTRAEAAEAKVAELTRQRDEALEVLKPFAAAADHAEAVFGHDGPMGQYIELDALRNARSILTPDTAGKDTA